MKSKHGSSNIQNYDYAVQDSLFAVDRFQIMLGTGL